MVRSDTLEKFLGPAENDLFIKMPTHMTFGPYGGLARDRAVAVAPWMREVIEPEPPPEPQLANAERYPTLAATGFVFAEAIDLGPVTRPACACPTCGRLTERVEAP